MISYVDPAGNLVALSLDGATRVELASDVSRVGATMSREMDEPARSKVEGLEELGPGDRPLAQRERQRGPLRIELLLGLLALILVIGFGGADWIEQQQLNAAYLRGVAAQGRHEWDLALSEFKAAGDFRDAAALAVVSARQITERDANYRAGLRAEDAADWELAYNSFGMAETIQPGFKDSAARQHGAVCHLERVGLAGLAYSVDGVGAGLYYYGGGRATALPRSDGKSELRGSADDGSILVYDVPGEGDAAELRRLMLAYPATGGDGCAGTTEVAAPRVVELPDTIGGVGIVTITKHGFWWRTPGPITANFQTYPFPLYYSFVSGSVAPLIIPGPGWRLLDMDARNERLLLAEYDGAVDGGQTRLYLAGPDGGDRVMVDQLAGFVSTARFSSDGKGIVFLQRTTNRLVGSIDWLISIGLDDHAIMATMATATVTGDSASSLSFALVPGPEGLVVVRERSEDNSHDLFYTYSPLHHRTLPLWVDRQNRFSNRSYFFTPDGRYVLFQTANGEGSDLVVLPLDDAGGAVHYSLPSGPTYGDVWLVSAMLADSRLVYTVRYGTSGVLHDSVWSLDMAARGDAGAPVPVFAGDRDVVGTPPWPQTTLPGAGKLVASLEGRYGLVAATLDGGLSIPVAGGADTVWAVGGPGYEMWTP